MEIISQKKLTPAEILEWIQSEPVQNEWSFAECRPSQTGKWSHDYHRYPAKFIPQLVEKLLDEYVLNKNASSLKEMVINALFAVAVPKKDMNFTLTMSSQKTGEGKQR